MDQNLMESVLPIRIGNNDNTKFKGTGFIIHSSDNVTYIITCWHVVEDFQEGEKIEVGGFDAELFDKDSGLDLAILKIPKRLDDNQGNERFALNLCKSGNKEMRISILGWRKQNAGKVVQREIEGKLRSQINFNDDKSKNIYIPAWDLAINDPTYKLEHGYSGSPVIYKEANYDEKTNYVLGIVSYREGFGETGQAIAVENIRHLEKFWRDIPKAAQEKIFKVHPSHFRIYIAVVAMTQEEAEQLDTGKVFGEHGEDTKEFGQFQELKKALGIKQLAVQYGLSRDAWYPLGKKRGTIREIIQNLVEEKINPNRRPQVFIDYVSDLLIPPNNELSSSICDELIYCRGIIVIDPISLYHPKIKDLIQSSYLLGRDDDISIIVTFPLDPKTYEIEGKLEKYIYRSPLLKRTFDHFENFSEKFDCSEFGVGSTYSLRRRIHEAIKRIRAGRRVPNQAQIEAAFGEMGEDTGIGSKAVGDKYT